MKFAIYGVNFNNKGAELMLYAVKQQIQEWNKNNTLAADLRLGGFKQRNKLGINHLVYRDLDTISANTISTKGKIISWAANISPTNIFQKYNITLEAEVDTILDASGFAYSDQWGFQTTEEMASLYSKWKKEGKKIILLPQAFGPFTSEKIKYAFSQIVDNTDLIFARDEISYECIDQLGVPMDHVKTAPDFTNLVQGIEPSYIKDVIGKACIIPNIRMIDKTSSELSRAYLSFLSLTIEYLLDKGLKPFILLHQVTDFELGRQLQAQVTRTIPVIQEDNPLHIKGILGKCHLVISSRFHGLISALSQGIPCLGTGWSHKYQMLFKSYDCIDLLVNLEKDVEYNLKKLDLIICEPTRGEIIESINRAANCQKALAQEMWSDVTALIDPKSPSLERQQPCLNA